MKRLFATFVVLLFVCKTTCLASGEDETSLFNSSGTPTAYIADDLTIYLWSGKPVAYLERDDAGGFHIYGFNGKHLGWYVAEIVRDQKGKKVGAVKKKFITSTKFEPFKGYKKFKPYKSFKKYPHFRPFFSTDWSDMSLKLFLLQGTAEK